MDLRIAVDKESKYICIIAENIDAFDIFVGIFRHLLYHDHVCLCVRCLQVMLVDLYYTMIDFHWDR